MAGPCAKNGRRRQWRRWKHIIHNVAARSHVEAAVMTARRLPEGVERIIGG